MHTFQEKKIMPYKAELINQLILDVEKYPEFLPWCNSAKIILKNEKFFTAELGILFKGFAEKYKSRILSRKEHGIYLIEVEAISGPFVFLKNTWKIKPINSESEVDFHISFQLKSKILDTVVGAVFYIAVEKMINAFELRAKQHNFV